METDNKEKLTLKEFAGYLPYKLKVVDMSQENHLFDLNPWLFRQHQHVQPYFKNHLDQILNDESLKLCLRPISDLTKEITHNAQTFVPIVELAKINLTKKNIAKHSWQVGLGVISANSPIYGVVFQFHDLGFYYKYEGNLRPVINQLELFEKLYEWHFDIHNLIDRGLAIDINTLTND